MTQSNLTFKENQIIPEGYKKTEFGAIPENWQVKKLGDISTIYSGGTPNRKVNEYWDGSIPWVTTTLINGGEIKEAQEYITLKGYENSSAKWCEKETILMAMYGQGKTRGKVGKLAFGATINQACAAIKVDEKYNVNYILSFLNSKYEAIRDLSNAGGQENLSGNIVKSIPILIPSFNEQQNIATALSDTDALISELEKLIEKKQAIKTATMQQLLTGKTRLPEFALREDGTSKGYKGSELGQIPEDWEIYRLSDVSLIDPENLNSSTSHDYQFEYISLENVDRGILLGTTTQIFSTSPSRARRVVRCGDILISTVRPNLMSHYYFNKAQRDVVCSTGFSLARPIESKLNGLFFYYHLFGKIINNQIDKIVIGSNYPAINSNDVRNFKLMVPSLKEQHSIVKIFEQLDAEIAQRTTQLKKLQFIKQGMMQELLTGKTRLV